MQRFVFMIVIAAMLAASLSGISGSSAEAAHTHLHDHGHQHTEAAAHAAYEASLAQKSTFHGQPEEHGADHLLHHMDFCVSTWKSEAPRTQAVRQDVAQGAQRGTVVSPEISPPRAFSI